MTFGDFGRCHLMVHASLANVASPLAGNGLEGILNDLEDYNFTPFKLHLLCIDGHAWLCRRGNLVLVVAQSLKSQLEFRRITLVVHANDDESALRVCERASRLDALDIERLLQLQALPLVPCDNLFKFFSVHFRPLSDYTILSPYLN